MAWMNPCLSNDASPMPLWRTETVSNDLPLTEVATATRGNAVVVYDPSRLTSDAAQRIVNATDGDAIRIGRPASTLIFTTDYRGPLGRTNRVRMEHFPENADPLDRVMNWCAWPARFYSRIDKLEFWVSVALLGWWMFV